MAERGVWLAAGGVLVALAVAGCGSGRAPAGGTSAGNALVCRHYLAQRDWARRLTSPTITDAEQFRSDVVVDAAQSSGKLHADLNAMVATGGSSGRAYYDASARVYADCTGGGR